MVIDQAHEQSNAVVKGDGGAIGLTEDSATLRRWMVAGFMNISGFLLKRVFIINKNLYESLYLIPEIFLGCGRIFMMVFTVTIAA
jgi:hypothetical protein